MGEPYPTLCPGRFLYEITRTKSTFNYKLRFSSKVGLFLNFVSQIRVSFVAIGLHNGHPLLIAF